MQTATFYKPIVLRNVNQGIVTDELVNACMQLDASTLHYKKISQEFRESIDVLEDLFEYLWKQYPENWNVKMEHTYHDSYSDEIVFNVYGGEDVRICYGSFMISTVKRIDGTIERFTLMNSHVENKISLCA